jgi:hypothetical protein
MQPDVRRHFSIVIDIEPNAVSGELTLALRRAGAHGSMTLR